MKELKKYQNRLAALLITGVCAILNSLRAVYSSDIDNYVMSLVANHRFAGKEQSVYDYFLHPALCLVIEGVHRIFPMGDAFLITARMLIYLGIFWISYYILGKIENHLQKAAYAVGVIGMVLLTDLMRSNFTVWAGFFCMIGFWTLLTNKQYEKGAGIAGTFFIIVGSLWRWNVFVLFTPFIILHLSVQIMECFLLKRTEKIKSILVLGIIPMCLLCLVWGSKQAVDCLPEYREQRECNTARSNFLDYPKANWSDISEKIDGISENDYRVLSKWILFDTDFADTETFELLSKHANRKAYEINIKNIFVIQKRVLGVILESPILIMLMVYLSILFLEYILSKESGWYKIELLLACLGADIILMYFVYKGRAIERVYIATLMAALTIAGTLLINRKKRSVSFGFISLIFVICGILQFDVTTGQSVFCIRDSARQEDSNTYIWDTSLWVNDYVSSYMKRGELISEENLAHNLVAGAWIYHMTFFDEHLEKNGMENPMKALIERTDVYYVSNDCKDVRQYLTEHELRNVVAREAGSINNNSVWKFEYD